MDKSKFNIKSEWRNFGIGLGVTLGVIAAVLLIKKSALAVYFFGAAGGIVLIALVLPILLKPVFIIFSYFGFGMGWVMTRVLLGILFYLVITPIHWLSWLFGKRFLDTKFNRDQSSHWLDNPELAREEAVQQYENQF